MKKFNLNDYIYIQITELGWKHLLKTVGDDYIKSCINTEAYIKIIDGKTWHRLQAHSVFNLLPIEYGGAIYFNTNIMIDEDALL